MAAFGSVAALVGAAGWASAWIGYDLLFDLLNTNVIIVPQIVEVIALFLVAVIVGGPVGYVIRSIPRRGKNLAICVAVGCTIAAVVLGEISYVAWLIYREQHVFSFSAAWNILPRLEIETGVIHMLIKLMAAGLSVVLAVIMAMPPKPKLNL